VSHECYRRKSIRLKEWDYTEPGAYFVTICTHRRAHLFGRVVDGVMELNEFGEIVRDAWFDLPNHYHHVELDAFVIMPNHVHGIIALTVDLPANFANSVGAGLRPAPTASTEPGPAHTEPTSSPLKRHPLSEIVRAFKSFSARRINVLRETPGARVWQRNYWEHIIRNKRALDAIRRYIVYNPARWAWDRYNPDAIGPDPWAKDLWNMIQEDARSVGMPHRITSTSATSEDQS